MTLSVFDRVENIVGKGEIACISNFSFSNNVIKRTFSQRRQKVSLCGNGLKCMNHTDSYAPSAVRAFYGKPTNENAKSADEQCKHNGVILWEK